MSLFHLDDVITRCGTRHVPKRTRSSSQLNGSRSSRRLEKEAVGAIESVEEDHHGFSSLARVWLFGRGVSLITAECRTMCMAAMRQVLRLLHQLFVALPELAADEHMVLTSRRVAGPRWRAKPYLYTVIVGVVPVAKKRHAHGTVMSDPKYWL